MFEVETLFLICIMLLPIVTGAYTFYKSFKVVEEEQMFEVVILLLYFGYLAFLSIAMHFHIVEVLR